MVGRACARVIATPVVAIVSAGTQRWLAIFGNDDGYAISEAEVVFPAVSQFREVIRENCGLNLRLSKCLVYTQSGVLPAEAPVGMELRMKRAVGYRGFAAMGFLSAPMTMSATC